MLSHIQIYFNSQDIYFPRNKINVSKKEEELDLEILISGGFGFIGSHLVKKLVSEGHKIVVLDNLSTGSKKNLEGLDVKRLSYSAGYIQFLNEKFDLIFHLGIPSTSLFYKDNPQLVSSVIKDWISVLEYARVNNSKIVYGSTSSLYNGNTRPCEEDMPIFITDIYTEAAYYVERLAYLYDTLYDVNSIGLRLFSVYGPGEESKGKYANVISQFLWNMKKGEPVVLYGKGNQERDFVYIDDVIEALNLAAKYNGKSDIFNVGTGISYSLTDMIKLIEKESGIKAKKSFIPNPVGNYVFNTQADTTKSREVLHFEAKINLQSGIRNLLE